MYTFYFPLYFYNFIIFIIHYYSIVYKYKYKYMHISMHIFSCTVCILLYKGVTGNKASLGFLRQADISDKDPVTYSSQSSQQIYSARESDTGVSLSWRNSHLCVSVWGRVEQLRASQSDHLTFHPSYTWQKKRDSFQKDHVTLNGWMLLFMMPNKLISP